MPKIAIDFSKCCIYKIEHISNESLLYIGYTTNFNKRKCEHKNNCKNVNNKEFNKKLYQMVRENGGWEMFRMIEVEKYPCNDRREAERRETELMKELKASMNSVKSYLSDEEKKQIAKAYREEHKEQFKEQRKDYFVNYYLMNKEQETEKNKLYYEKNTEKIKEKHKHYYQANKDKRKETIKCVCGCEISKCSYIRHKKSKKHFDNMNLIKIE